MKLDDSYIADDISIRDQDGKKLIYQRNRDHMYLIPDFGAKILNAFGEERSMSAALHDCGIRWEELDAPGRQKITEFVNGLLDRQLLLKVSVANSGEGKGGDQP